MRKSQPQNELSNDLQIVPMSVARKLLVLGLVVFVFAGHGYCMLKNREVWPFSQYPMYSGRNFKTWTDEYLVGTSRIHPSREVPISYLVYDRPISVKTAVRIMSSSLDTDDGSEEKLQQTLRGLGQLYVDKRGGNRPADYEEIGQLRLYQVTWMIVAGQGKQVRETNRQLLMEVDLPTTTQTSEVQARGGGDAY